MTNKRNKYITYEQLERKYSPPFSLSGGLKRGAEEIAI